jgi:hypothetical protein
MVYGGMIMMELAKSKSIVIGLPVLLVALLFHFGVPLLVAGYAGFLSALASAIVFGISAAVTSAILSVITKSKEKMLAFFATILVVLIASNLVNMVIGSFVKTLVAGLA